MSSPLDSQSSMNEDQLPNLDMGMHMSSFDSISLYTYRAGLRRVTKSGSNWGLEEEKLFRICYKEDTRDPRWPNLLPSSILSNNPLWEEFVGDSNWILQKTNKEIRSHFKELSGFFIALANILRSPVASTSTLLTKRLRKIRQLPDQASKQSLHELIGSSSPLQPSSQGSAYHPALVENDDDLDEEQERKQAEVASSSLASEFISLVIDIFLDQPISLKKRLAFHESPTKFIIASQDKTVDCKCLDDGSIIWHEWDQPLERWMLGKHVCSVETKPSFIQSDEEGKGKISSKMIPQYACELIGAVMHRSTDQDRKMKVNQWQPLIVTHSCYMTILSATFTPTYLEYIRGADNKLDGDPPFLEIYCTKTHDLKTPLGRQNAAEDLLIVCEKLQADDRDEQEWNEGSNKEVGNEESDEGDA